MRKQCILFWLVAFLGFAPLARADMVTDWNDVYLETIRATGGPPCPISRAGAMMHAAIYDAVNSIERTHEPFLFSFPASPSASREAAVAAAAHRVLESLYPERRAVFDAALSSSLSLVPGGPGKTEGIELGRRVADALLLAREGDGTATDPPYVIGEHPGEWRPTPPDFTSPPFNPGWGATRPWTMIDGAQFRPVGPAGFSDMAALLASPEYAGQLNEVKELGRLDSSARTAYETETAFFWANDSDGTYKPPGHLNYITQVISAERGLSLTENARLFALVNIAMADAGLVAWDMKYRTAMDLWRPVTAIHLADTDGNLATSPDAAWEPLNPFSPPFPAYISGHATFGAAHASVLRNFLGTDNVTFTITSDDTPGVFRTYHRLSDAALENGRSRIFLGVHFQFDADDGYTAGTALGDYVTAKHLRPLGRFLRCDANASGVVDLSDAIWILNRLFRGGPPSACREAADCNGDGQVDISDPLYAIAYRLLGGSPPPAPYPECGTDLRSTAESCPEAASPCPSATFSADPGWVRHWNRIALDASGLDHTEVAEGEERVFGEQLGPCRSSRALAIVQIAVFEVVNAVAGGYRSYAGLPAAAPGTSLRAAIAQAAHDTLVELFPSQAAKFERELAAELSAVGIPTARLRGIELGRRAAAAILARRAADGSGHAEPLYGVDYLASDQPGRWRQDPISRHPLALGARWPEVRPFAMSSASQFRAPEPPALGSPEYAAAYDEAKALGGDGETTPTERRDDGTFMGIFWAYDGTPSLCAPPRLYNQIAVQIATQQHADIVELARLLALANVAMADAGIAVWESKYFYDYWRPVTGIREADAGTGPTGAGDGNPATTGDPSFTPLGAPASNLAGVNFTPPFPAYPSGHAGFGGALFQTLRRFYGTDALAFTFLSDEFNGKTIDSEGNLRPVRRRSFTSLSQAEEENGQSRIYLGIHWSFDKTEGIAQGRGVADLVFESIFEPLR
jgi:membrane-associated phospholipid phosphatase